MNVNERSVSHKLAEHLQKFFPDFEVDCEYNRMNKEIINYEYITKKINLSAENILTHDSLAKTVYPDIIIHKRKKNDNNLLIVEMKTYYNESAEKNEQDILKIKLYMKQLKYRFGIFVVMDVNIKKTQKCSQFFRLIDKKEKNRNEFQTNGYITSDNLSILSDYWNLCDDDMRANSELEDYDEDGVYRGQG